MVGSLNEQHKDDHKALPKDDHKEYILCAGLAFITMAFD